MTIYTLYNRTGSGGFVVEAALALAAVPFELVSLESSPGTPISEDFRKINPWGQVPTLVLPSGATLTETTAILIYLAAEYPERRLAPSPGEPLYGAFLRWLIFACVNVYEPVLRITYPSRYTDDPSAQAATASSAQTHMMNALVVIEEEKLPGPFLLGERMTVLDLYIAMLFDWFDGEIHTPGLDAVRSAVRQDRVAGPIWQRHFG